MIRVEAGQGRCQDLAWSTYPEDDWSKFLEGRIAQSELKTSHLKAPSLPN